MKKLKAILISIFSAVCVLCACAGLSACFSSGGESGSGNGEGGNVADDTGNESGEKAETPIDKWNRYDGVKLSFIREKDCSEGEIDDEKLMPELNGIIGEKYYMVVDFDIQAEYDNDGVDTVTAGVTVRPATALAATIQETNSGNVSEEVNDGNREIKATYKIPDKAETVRNMRLIIQFEPLANSEAYIDISFTTESEMQVIKTPLIKKAAMCGKAEMFGYLDYELNDGEYTVTGCNYKGYTLDLVIPSMWNGRYVTGIAASAFKNVSLKKIVIPETVTRLGEYLFAENRLLEKITVCEGNEQFKSETNCILSKDGKTLIYGCRSSVIPDGVEEIAANAFYKSYIAGFTIPESVTKIGENAFSECNRLTEVNVTSLSTWLNIKFGNISANPLSQGHCLYLNGKMVTDLVVPDGISAIQNYALRGCKGIVSVTIPASVERIGMCAFTNCTLTTLNLAEGLKEIRASAFARCTSLASLELPQSVESIGEEAFWGCEKLSELNLDYVKYIGNGAFQSCTSLTKVSLNGIEGIGYGAFSACSKLYRVTIGAKAEEIGPYAFSNCIALTYGSFGGTVARWNKIADKTAFDFCGDNFKLRCSDGNI